MEIQKQIQDNDVMLNPLLRNKFQIMEEDNIIELSIVNLSKYFQKIYILCPLRNEQVDEDIFCKNISAEKWNQLDDKLVLEEVGTRILRNFEHNHNLLLVKSSELQQFNKFGFNLTDKIIVLPIFNISYKNINKYLKIYDGHSTLEDLYRILIINDYFSRESKLSFNSKVYISDIIKSLEESNYWTRQYNCLQNISKQFSNRMFKLKVTRNLKNEEIKKAIKSIESDNKINNYLENIFNNKNFVDASSCLKNNGYKLYVISKPSEITKRDIVTIFSKLNFSQRYYMFSNLLISKKYCHLMINNFDLLMIMKDTISAFGELYRYLIGYAWVRFYTEECIKKSKITNEDEFIFDINTASLLQVYPYGLANLKKNPYLPILVDDKSLQAKNNLGGFCNYNSDEDSKHINKGIIDLNGFKKRVNIFITGNSNNDIFKDIDWNEVEMGITGSIMAACLQKRHPLMNLFEGKNNFGVVPEFDLDYSRYFNEYYPEADVDIMIRSSTPLDFMKKCKQIFNQMVVNICNFNPSNVEPHHVKMDTIQTIYLFVNDSIINKISKENPNLTSEYIIKNLDSSEINELFKPYFDTKIKEFNENLYEEFSEEEFREIKKNHPELFDKSDKIDLQVHYKEKNKFNFRNDKSEDKDLDNTEEDNEIDSDKLNKNCENVGINITFKVKIHSIHISKELELFPIKGDDFFSIVSKFHLPCVRSYYNGKNVYLTPSCVSAHLTYLNLDYKYFAGSNDELKIILKYRMRGFGTLLNKNEIDKIIKYINKVTFWKRLYDIDIEEKETIKSALGDLTYDLKLLHPRLYNSDLYADNVPYVNISDGYNQIETNLEKVEGHKHFNDMIQNHIGSIKLDLDLYNLQTIGKDGYILPVQKDKIICAYEKAKSEITIIDNSEKKVSDSKAANKQPVIFWDSEELVESSEDSS